MASGAELMAKSPDPIDLYVGGRLRTARILAGLSQEKLGDALNVTFQQIQKYEKGTNRISASRLQTAARILALPVSHFFEDAPGGPSAFAIDPNVLSREEISSFLGSHDGTQLVRAFMTIPEGAARRRLLNLAKAMAEAD